MNRNKLIYYGCIIIGLVCYAYQGHFIERSSHLELISSFALLFLSFFWLQKTKEIGWKEILWIGIGFRLILLFSTPWLSQDFYRFFWDGEIQLLGFNPYEFSPNELLSSDQKSLFSKTLYDGMGGLSQSNYSNYPPVSQWLFTVLAFLSNGNLFSMIIGLRLVHIAADIGLFFVGKELLKKLKLPEKNIGWYFLNPLVIIELIGNLHGEGLMLVFLLFAVFMLTENRVLLAGVFMAMGVGAKLIPLFFLLILIYPQKWKDRFYFLGSVGFSSLVIWGPYLSVLMGGNYWVTIRLWFDTFEFNGSIYNLIRSVGYQIKGYNVIKTIGKFTPFVVMVLVFVFSVLKKNDTLSRRFKNMLFLITAYLFISTTVHPWYVITPLLFGVFTNYRFALLWTATVTLSYTSYGIHEVYTDPIMLFLEYLPVYLLLILEVSGKANRIKAFVRS